MDEEVVIKPDTTELESATADAERSAQVANESAVAATAAAINQGQIIEVVTSAAREDANRAREQSESAANNAARSAEIAVVASETAISEIRSMMEEHNNRLLKLEESNSQPIQVVDNNSVSPINPQQTEQESRESDLEEVNTESKPKTRRSHGRRKR